MTLPICNELAIYSTLRFFVLGRSVTGQAANLDVAGDWLGNGIIYISLISWELKDPL